MKKNFGDIMYVLEHTMQGRITPYEEERIRGLFVDRTLWRHPDLVERTRKFLEAYFAAVDPLMKVSERKSRVSKMLRAYRTDKHVFRLVKRVIFNVKEVAYRKRFGRIFPQFPNF